MQSKQNQLLEDELSLEQLAFYVERRDQLANHLQQMKQQQLEQSLNEQIQEKEVYMEMLEGKE